MKSCLFAGLALVAASACAPRTERLTPVAAERAPTLARADENVPAEVVLHAGDLVAAGAVARAGFAWKGTVDEQDDPIARSGELIEVRRAASDAPRFAFRGDLGAAVDVESAARICQSIEGGKDCVARLRRILVDGVGLVAFVPCERGGCPVALIHDGHVERVTVDGLVDAQVTTLNGQRALLASAFRKYSEHNEGHSLFVLRFQPQLARALEIITGYVDTTHNNVRSRDGKLRITPDQIRFQGHERITTANGLSLGDREVDETYKLSPAPAR